MSRFGACGVVRAAQRLSADLSRQARGSDPARFTKTQSFQQPSPEEYIIADYDKDPHLRNTDKDPSLTNILNL